jgi:hypothetical protein
MVSKKLDTTYKAALLRKKRNFQNVETEVKLLLLFIVVLAQLLLPGDEQYAVIIILQRSPH